MQKEGQETIVISKKGTAVSLGVVILLVIVAYNYGALSDSVKANASSISEIKASYKNDLHGIQTDLGIMKTSIGNIEGYLEGRNENRKNSPRSR